jgi:hypothetical protein
MSGLLLRLVECDNERVRLSAVRLRSRRSLLSLMRVSSCLLDVKSPPAPFPPPPLHSSPTTISTAPLSLTSVPMSTELMLVSDDKVLSVVVGSVE